MNRQGNELPNMLPHSLQLACLSFAYDEVKALDCVEIGIASGQILGLVGANGAGKSTLVKILAGLLPGYHGVVAIDGIAKNLTSPSASIDAGIAISMQEPEFAWNLSVRENCETRCLRSFEGNLEGRQTSWLAETIAKIKSFGSESILDARISQLDRRQLQILQISLALAQPANVIILDEPTTSLTEVDKATLFHYIKTLTEAGACALFISHQLEDVLHLSSAVVVLKDGRNRTELSVTEIDLDFVVSSMYDTCHGPQRWAPAPQKNLALRLVDLATQHLNGFSLDLFKGEIVGLVSEEGYITELFRAMAGLKQPKSGEILIGDKTLAFRRPQDAIRAGIGYLPEDRRRDGLFPNLSILQNMVITSLDSFSSNGIFNERKAAAEASSTSAALKLKHAGVKRGIRTLSGGNQQKVMLTRLLFSGSSVMLLEEPTAGMDPSSRDDLYRSLRALALEGTSILISSREPAGLSEVCDRVYTVSSQPEKELELDSLSRGGC